ncbi:MAG: hypothetical protein OEW08_04395 [Gammaproteobacteria bacterium]|nr:hypothetical protein [Gammaproteobacteria bacterium]
MKNLSASTSFQIPGGPTLSATTSLEISAYDRIDVTVNAGDASEVVEIQPSAADKVRLLVIKSSVYDDTGKLTYIVSNGTDDSNPVNLDAPQIFIGSGGIELFGIDPPSSLKFSSTFSATDTTKNAFIEILVARNATQ